MKNLYYILLGTTIAIGCTGISSCSSDDVILTGQQNDVHTVRLKMQADMTSYGDTPSSRATTSWQEGSQIFIYSNSLKGNARYTNGYWTLSYSGDISSETACEIYYFDNPIGIDASGAVLNSYSSFYKTTTAKLVKDGNEVILNGTLNPVCGRIRFRDSSLPRINIKGYKSLSKYTNNTKTLSTSIEGGIDLTFTNGYTPYIYLADDGKTQEVTLTANGVVFKRTLNATHLGAGLSGYFDVPTQQDPKGWTYISGGIEDALNVTPFNCLLLSTGSEQTINVTCNNSWTVSANDSWVKLSTTSGNSNGSFKISATANPSSSVRNSSVTVKCGKLQEIINVKQNAPSTISPQTCNFVSLGGAQSITVSSDVAWNIKSNNSWISANMSTGTGNGNFTITTTANTTSSSRNGSVTVTFGTTNVTISITQNAGSSIDRNDYGTDTKYSNRR